MPSQLSAPHRDGMRPCVPLLPRPSYFLSFSILFRRILGSVRFVPLSGFIPPASRSWGGGGGGLFLYLSLILGRAHRLDHGLDRRRGGLDPSFATRRSVTSRANRSPAKGSLMRRPSVDARSPLRSTNDAVAVLADVTVIRGRPSAIRCRPALKSPPPPPLPRTRPSLSSPLSGSSCVLILFFMYILLSLGGLFLFTHLTVERCPFLFISFFPLMVRYFLLYLAN